MCYKRCKCILFHPFLGYSSCACDQTQVCLQDQGVLQEVQTMFEELKGGLQTLQEQVADSMHSQTAHFQKRELYQQEKTQLQEQVSKLIEQNLATHVSPIYVCIINLFW